MKLIRFGILVLLVTLCAVSQTRSAEKTGASVSDREKLIGAWHLASMVGPGWHADYERRAGRHADLYP